MLLNASWPYCLVDDLLFLAGDAAPFFFFHHSVECEGIAIGFTDTFSLAGENPGKAEQAA